MSIILFICPCAECIWVNVYQRPARHGMDIIICGDCCIRLRYEDVVRRSRASQFRSAAISRSRNTLSSVEYWPVLI